MKIEFEKYMSEPFTCEVMIAEAVIQSMMAGNYVDITDIKKNFSHEH